MRRRTRGQASGGHGGRVRALLCVAFCVASGIILTGCGNHTDPVADVIKPTPTPAPVRAYVRLDALVAASPLQADVARLRMAETRLRSLARGQTASGAEPAASYRLSALSASASGSVGDIERARRIREQNDTAGRDRLQQIVTAELSDYDADRKQRQQQRIDQRRAEMEAVDYGHAADREKAARDAATLRALSEVQAVALNVSITEAKIAVLTAQVGRANPTNGPSEPGTFPPIEDLKAFKADVDKILANPITPEMTPEARQTALANTAKIGMQARLEAKHQVERATLEALRAKLVKIHADAAARADKAVMQIAQQQLDEIEQQLETLSQDQGLQFQLRDQKVQLADVLAAQAAVTDKVAAEGKRLGSAGTLGSEAGAGSVEMATLFGPAFATADRAGALGAADRVAKQRERLERYIRIDVAAAVKDAAVARNVDVLTVSNGSTSASQPSTAGRNDMTAQFAHWINPDSQRIGPVAGEPKATAAMPTPAVPARSGG